MSAETTAQPAAPARAARRTRTGLLVWVAVLAGVDLAIKALAETLLATGATVELGVMNIRLLHNTGVAFSLGSGLPVWVVITATGLIITALVWHALKTAPAMTGLSLTGAALLIGGAIGNFIDRLDGRGVVDYLHTGWFATFNLADAFVTVGVGLYILGTLITTRPPPQP
ncbi:signal peptidase II [Arthrobacter alpinus]|uniref:signal peptidase II n=1 Tax=Micrococcaceae TaxID=1268 RepID=UPI000CE338BC|nr:signal peptidase II [Arthrobacter sp. N199823]MDD0856652.1 signal peptidase II [Arthrobacter alpinus]